MREGGEKSTEGKRRRRGEKRGGGRKGEIVNVVGKETMHNKQSVKMAVMLHTAPQCYKLWAIYLRPISELSIGVTYRGTMTRLPSATTAYQLSDYPLGTSPFLLHPDSFLDSSSSVVSTIYYTDLHCKNFMVTLTI